MSAFPIVGLDLSVASTGLALYDDGAITTHRIQTKLEKTGPLVENKRTGKAERTQSYTDKAERFRRIGIEVMHLIPRPAHVYLEGPSYSSPGASGHDIAGNWWNVYRVLRSIDCSIHVIPPSNVKKYAVGKGSGADAGKDRILAAAIKRYPEIDITGNDVADAVHLLAIGCRLQGMPLEDSMPVANLEALTALTEK